MRDFPTDRERAAYELGKADGKAEASEEPLTLDAVKKMSQAEVIDRKAEVDAVLGGGAS